MEREIMLFGNAMEFESWLAINQAQSAGIWVQIAKKGSGLSSISYAEALDSALCFGWIDGQKAKKDEHSWLQYFARRKSSSIWSQLNKKHVERLILAGRMQGPGLAAIEAAKRSGQWDAAYQGIRSRAIPPELEEAFSHNQRAKDFFETLDSQNRFAFVFRISTAKKAETKLKRTIEYIRMMENGEVFHPRD